MVMSLALNAGLIEEDKVELTTIALIGPTAFPLSVKVPLLLSTALKPPIKLLVKLPPAGVLLGLLIFCAKAAATCAAVKPVVAVSIRPPTVAVSPGAIAFKRMVCCA
ncbi:hypothetical protein POPA111323_01995 [Polynucleobacter paneuropaeus]